MSTSYVTENAHNGAAIRKPTFVDNAQTSPLHTEPDETQRPSIMHRASSSKVEASVEDYKMFISFVFSVSIFGASTFAVIVGQMTDPVELWKPDPPPFTMATVRTFLALAWLCFILSIAVAGYSSSLLTLWKQSADGIFDEKWGKSWDNVGILASAMLHLLLVSAFLFLSLALVSYAYVPGWVAVGFSCLAGIFTVGLSFYQFR